MWSEHASSKAHAYWELLSCAVCGGCGRVGTVAACLSAAAAQSLDNPLEGGKATGA